MRQTLNVHLNKEYKIILSDESLETLQEDIFESSQGQKKLFVVSEKVFKLYKKIFRLTKENTFILPDGEKEKNIKNYLAIIQKAGSMNLTRDDVIIALGGGVTGDIAGFAASTYMRGIDYIQIPTTLLSMVDSSVGGKTAIDLKEAKNLIGTFYQPKAVFININFLKTLDNRQFRSGLGEILKYALLEESCKEGQGLYLFEYLTLGCEKVFDKDPLTITRIIEHCLNLKISIVTQDEKEYGLRRILNLGHTYAHALETISKYRKYTHGEAVVQGLFFILKYAYSKKLITYSYYRLSTELLDKYGFKEELLKYSKDELISVMKQDKKAAQDKIRFIVPYDRKRVKEVLLSEDEVYEML